MTGKRKSENPDSNLSKRPRATLDCFLTRASRQAKPAPISSAPPLSASSASRTNAPTIQSPALSSASPLLTPVKITTVHEKDDKMPHLHNPLDDDDILENNEDVSSETSGNFVAGHRPAASREQDEVSSNDTELKMPQSKEKSRKWTEGMHVKRRPCT